MKMKKLIAIIIAASLLFQQTGFAQVAPSLNVAGGISGMAGYLVPDKFRPMHLRYLSFDAQSNNFDLLLDKGDIKQSGQPQIQETTAQLMDYFMIGLSLPNNAFWVNLRPDSPQNIIDNDLARTELGKVLLEADLQLKKDCARHTSPDTAEGREYWNRLYARADALFGADEDLDIPAMTRPWIVPGEIIISETAAGAYVLKATMKVMLEEDYLKDEAGQRFSDGRVKELNAYSAQLMRELILPKLTREINNARRYSSLRQVFYSLVLAQWYKSRAQGKTDVLAARIDAKDLTGLTSKTAWSKDTYFQAYRKSFAEGEYNRQEHVRVPGGVDVRTYVSGGAAFQNAGALVVRSSALPEKIGNTLPAVFNPEYLSRDYSVQNQDGGTAAELMAQVRYVMDMLGITDYSRITETFRRSIDPGVFVDKLAEATGKDTQAVLAVLNDSKFFAPVAAKYRMLAAEKLDPLEFAVGEMGVRVSSSRYTLNGSLPHIAGEPISDFLDLMREAAGEVPFVFRDDMDKFVAGFLSPGGTASAKDLLSIIRDAEEFLKTVDLSKIEYIVTSGIGANEMYSHQLAQLLNAYFRSQGIKARWIVVNNPANLKNDIPEDANNGNTIVFEMSRSGTTKETVDFFNATRDRFLTRIVAVNEGPLKTAAEELQKERNADVKIIGETPGDIGGRQMNRKTLMVYMPLFIVLTAGLKDTGKAKDYLSDYVGALYDANEKLRYSAGAESVAVNLAEALYRGIKEGRNNISLIHDESLRYTAKEMKQLINEGANKKIAGGSNNNILQDYSFSEDSAIYNALLTESAGNQMPVFLLDTASKDYQAMQRYVAELKGKGLPVIAITLESSGVQNLEQNLQAIARLSALLQDATVYFTHITSQDANSNPAVKMVREITAAMFEILAEKKAKGLAPTISVEDVVNKLNSKKADDGDKAARAISSKGIKKISEAEVFDKTPGLRPFSEEIHALAQGLGMQEQGLTSVLIGAVSAEVLKADIGEAGGNKSADIDEAFSRTLTGLGKFTTERTLEALDQQILLREDKGYRVSVLASAAEKKGLRLKGNLSEQIADYLAFMYGPRQADLQYMGLTHMAVDAKNPLLKSINEYLVKLFAPLGITVPLLGLPDAAHTGIEAFMSHPENAFNVAIVYTDTYGKGFGTQEIETGVTIDEATYIYGIANVIRIALGGTPSIVFEVDNQSKLPEVQRALEEGMEKFKERIAEGAAVARGNRDGGRKELAQKAREKGLEQLARDIEEKNVQDKYLGAVKELFDHSQEHLFEDWGQWAQDDKKHFLEDVRMVSISFGGIGTLIEHYHELLVSAQRGDNPFEDQVPSNPKDSGVWLRGLDEEHVRLDRKGLALANRLGAIILMGGTGDRLEFEGIKGEIPLDLATMTNYLEKHITSILAFQEIGNAVNKEKRFNQVIIITSQQTHDMTERILKENEYFGLRKEQVNLLKQRPVPTVSNIEGDLVLDKDNHALEGKPGGSGDAWTLVRESGMLERWSAAGIEYCFTAQDTNIEAYNGIVAALGVSLEKNYDANVVTISRKPGENIGLIARMTKETDSKVRCVEYNQAKPLFDALGIEESRDAEGYSEYPGNTNIIVFKTATLIKALDLVEGKMPPFINPKWEDSERGTLKKSVREERMVQDALVVIARDEINGKVGFTDFQDRELVFGPAKNALESGAENLIKGIADETIIGSERIHYQNWRKMLARAGVAINAAPEDILFDVQGIPVYRGALVSLDRSFAHTISVVLERFHEGTIGDDAALTAAGDVYFDNLQLDRGALDVRAGEGVTIHVNGLNVKNKGWRMVPLQEKDAQREMGIIKEIDPDAAKYFEMRGYMLIKYETAVIDIREPGIYDVTEKGEIFKRGTTKQWGSVSTRDGGRVNIAAYLNKLPRWGDVAVKVREMARDYDKRYISAEPFDSRLAFLEGLHVGKKTKESLAKAGVHKEHAVVLLAADARAYNPAIFASISDGLRYLGLQVIDLTHPNASDESEFEPNTVTTYSAAVQLYNPEAAIFITASHISSDLNVVGFKEAVFKEKGMPIQSLSTQEIKEESVAQIKSFLENPESIKALEAETQPEVIRINPEADAVRLNTLIGRVAAFTSEEDKKQGISIYDLAKSLRDLTGKTVDSALKPWEERIDPTAPATGIEIVIEGSNTPAGPLSDKTLSNLGVSTTLLNEKVVLVQGKHTADPSKEENLKELKKKLEEVFLKSKDKFVFGIAYDLDGDRGAIIVPVIDEKTGEVDFKVLAPDNLIVAMLDYFVRKWGYDQATKLAVIKDVLGTNGVNNAADGLNMETEVSDAGYPFLKAKLQQLNKNGYVTPIYGERSGHAWLDVTGAIENPLAVAILFMTMVKQEMESNPPAQIEGRNPFWHVYVQKTIPFKQSPRVQYAFGGKLLKLVSDGLSDAQRKEMGGWTSEDSNIPQAVIGLGRHKVIEAIQKDFSVGTVKDGRVAGQLKVSDLKTEPGEDGLLRFADINFKDADGNEAGHMVVRASSNEPAFVGSYETPILNGDTLKAEKIMSAIAGIVFGWLESNGFAVISKAPEQQQRDYNLGSTIRYMQAYENNSLDGGTNEEETGVIRDDEEYANRASEAVPNPMPDQLGGIDFRSLPSGGAVNGQRIRFEDTGFARMPVAKNADLDAQWKAISAQMEQGNSCADKQLREYLAACCQSDRAVQRRDQMLLCISALLRSEEDEVSATSAEVKELLLALNA